MILNSLGPRGNPFLPDTFPPIEDSLVSGVGYGMPGTHDLNDVVCNDGTVKYYSLSLGQFNRYSQLPKDEPPGLARLAVRNHGVENPGSSA